MYDLENCRNFKAWMIGRIYNSYELWYVTDKNRNFIKTCYSPSEAVNWLSSHSEEHAPLEVK